ncbi:hypothetical protein XENOCAPTIV_012267, partial [Xenoophorus captivus]
QEGWRLENEDPTDPSSPLVFKGVVFNEMKGVFVSQYDGSTKEASFSIGLQGMAEQDTERVKQIIGQTIDQIIDVFPLTKGYVPVQYCEQPTNGLVYFRAMCSLNTLPEDLRVYVPLFCSIITNPHFDNEERLRVLVMMAAQELANGISHSGHMYAMTRAGRHLTPAGELQETFDGMEQVIFMPQSEIYAGCFGPTEKCI